MSERDELPDTERPPLEERLADALETIADILAESKESQDRGLDKIERSLALAIGGVREQQERDYARVTRLDEEHLVHLRSIDTGIAKILKLLGPIPEQIDSQNKRILDLERKASNGSGATRQ